MVGETQARPFAKNNAELLEMFKTRKLAVQKKIVDTKKMIGELERELAALDSEDNVWDAAIFELENMGKQTGPKKRKRKEEEEEEEEEEGEEERE